MPTITLAAASSKLRGVVRLSVRSGQMGVLSFWSTQDPFSGFGDEPGFASEQGLLVFTAFHSLSAFQDVSGFMESHPTLLFFISVPVLIHNVDDVVKDSGGPEIQEIEERNHSHDPEEFA